MNHLEAAIYECSVMMACKVIYDCPSRIRFVRDIWYKKYNHLAEVELVLVCWVSKFYKLFEPLN